ncbi:membrane protein [Synergistales bacterium]|nr:membrane protein [Synergistales bacterium]
MLNSSNMPFPSSTLSNIEATNAFFRKVYNWMAAGLILTAITAHVVASSDAMVNALYSSRGLLMALVIVEVGLVFFLSMAINKISAATASMLFIAYSLLNGVTLSSVLLVYTSESVFAAFLTTAGMFGAMSVYGLYTKRDLTSMGGFLMMGLWGLIIAMVVNMFLGSSMLELVISGIGVLVFMGLTAYDTQYLRELGGQVDVNGLDDTPRKMVIIGSLKLYLDFVNLFIYLLRFLGNRRD